MLFESIRSEGLAHNSYLIGSQGKAAVIDPRRDCGIYRDIADHAGLAITHIFEPHRNEDYCIGSLQLAHMCRAEIFHGGNLPFQYGTPVREGDRFILGSLTLVIRETPGHTEESISIVLTDSDAGKEPYMVFSGDTLLAGDIARTDFFGRGRDAEMAGKIYDSIITRILPLGDGVILCPAHGAGSVCGTEITDHPFTTIGYERRTNPLLLLGWEEFLRQRISASHYTPPYFRRMEDYNLNGAPILPAGVPQPPPLSAPDVQELVGKGAQGLDIRSPAGFAAAHIPGSLSIWRGGVSSFTGWFFDYDNPIVIVDDFNIGLDPIVRQLMRLGYDNLAGFLAGGFPAWYRGAQETGSFAACTVQDLYGMLKAKSPFILDVRDSRNFQSAGHISGAYHVYVGELPGHLAEIPGDRPVVVTCDAGYKGSLAASFLAKNGFSSITNLLGGMQAWMRAGYPVVR